MQEQPQVGEPQMAAGSGDPEKKSVLHKMKESAKRKVKSLGTKLKPKGHGESGEAAKRELVDQSPPGTVEDEEEEEYEDEVTPSPVDAPASDSKDLNVPLDEMALMEQKSAENRDHEGSGAGRGLGDNLTEGLPSKAIAEHEPDHDAPPGALQAVPTEYHYKDESEGARDSKATETEQRDESSESLDEEKAGGEQPHTPAPSPEEPQSPGPTTEGESIFASKDGKSPDLSNEDVQALSSSNLYTGEPDIKSSKDKEPTSESRDIEAKDVKEEPAVEGGDKGTDFFNNQSNVMTSEGARDMDMPPSSMSNEEKDASEEPSEKPAKTNEEATESSRDMDLPPSSMSSEAKDVYEPAKTSFGEAPNSEQAKDANEHEETSLGSESTNIMPKSEGPSSEQVSFGENENKVPSSEERHEDVPATNQSKLGENERISGGDDVDAPSFSKEGEPSQMLDAGFSSSNQEESGGGIMDAKPDEKELKEQETPSAESKLEDESSANVNAINTPNKDFSETTKADKDTVPPSEHFSETTEADKYSEPSSKGFSETTEADKYTEPSSKGFSETTEADKDTEPPSKGLSETTEADKYTEPPSKGLSETTEADKYTEPPSKGFSETTEADKYTDPSGKGFSETTEADKYMDTSGKGFSETTEADKYTEPSSKDFSETTEAHKDTELNNTDEGFADAQRDMQPSNEGPERSVEPEEKALSDESKEPEEVTKQGSGNEGKVEQEENPSKENQAPNTHEQPGITSRFIHSIASTFGYSSPTSSPKEEQEHIVDQKVKDVV